MDTSNMADHNQHPHDPLYGINKALLCSEIGFWQEMLDSADASMTEEALERMEQALALAQSRLKSLSERFRPAPAKRSPTHGNVYCINKHRVSS